MGVDPKRANRVELVIRSVDRFQQRSTAAGFVVGVFKKFSDDRCSQLAQLIAFSAFLSFFPLMLIVITLTAFLAQRSPAIAERIRTSAVSEFPVVGVELTRGNQALPGSGIGLVIGFAGLLWGGLGFTHALQYGFLEIWHVPHKSRPPYVSRMTRSLAVWALLVAAVTASFALGLVGVLIKNSTLAGGLGMAAAFLVSAWLYLAVLWLLSPRHLSFIDLLPGALIAAFGWQALQTVGIRLVAHELRRSSELYGTIGAALGLIFFLLVSTQILLFALEVVVVRKDHLWPRSILRPPLTDPDKALLTAMAMQEERLPEETISVRFDGDS